VPTILRSSGSSSITQMRWPDAIGSAGNIWSQLAWNWAITDPEKLHSLTP